MLGFKRFTVKKNERGLLLRNGDFERVLQPGRHWLATALSDVRVETFSLEQSAFIDLNIIRHSHCFVPAHVESSFSYMVMRLKEFDRRVTRTGNIKPPHDGFYNWGF